MVVSNYIGYLRTVFPFLYLSPAFVGVQRRQPYNTCVSAVIVWNKYSVGEELLKTALHHVTLLATWQAHTHLYSTF